MFIVISCLIMCLIMFFAFRLWFLVSIHWKNICLLNNFSFFHYILEVNYIKIKYHLETDIIPFTKINNPKSIIMIHKVISKIVIISESDLFAVQVNFLSSNYSSLLTYVPSYFSVKLLRIDDKLFEYYRSLLSIISSTHSFF